MFRIFLLFLIIKIAILDKAVDLVYFKDSSCQKGSGGDTLSSSCTLSTDVSWYDYDHYYYAKATSCDDVEWSITSDYIYDRSEACEYVSHVENYAIGTCQSIGFSLNTQLFVNCTESGSSKAISSKTLTVVLIIVGIACSPCILSLLVLLVLLLPFLFLPGLAPVFWLISILVLCVFAFFCCVLCVYAFGGFFIQNSENRDTNVGVALCVLLSLGCVFVLGVSPIFLILLILSFPIISITLCFVSIFGVCLFAVFGVYEAYRKSNLTEISGGMITISAGRGEKPNFDDDEFAGHDADKCDNYEIVKRVPDTFHFHHLDARLPKLRICPLCHQLNTRDDRDCKHTTCNMCNLHFCHICLQVPNEYTGLFRRSSNPQDVVNVTWPCSGAFSRCNPPRGRSSEGNFGLFPTQTRRNRHEWSKKQEYNHWRRLMGMSLLPDSGGEEHNNVSFDVNTPLIGGSINTLNQDDEEDVFGT